MYELKLGDCLELMKDIQTESVDMILADLPYGKTKNKWDTVIPFENLWEHYLRVITNNGAIVLFGQGVFSAKLILSNEKLFRYSLIWNKINQSGFLNSARMPLRTHEDILVFYKKLPVYNPQMGRGKPESNKRQVDANENNNYGRYSRQHKEKKNLEDRFPISILNFVKPAATGRLHPTQKPVPLLEYLIKTYTNENMTVMDNVMGSGSTGVACVNTNRNFIGIERDIKYFEIAKTRIERSADVKASTVFHL